MPFSFLWTTSARRASATVPRLSLSPRNPISRRCSTRSPPSLASCSRSSTQGHKAISPKGHFSSTAAVMESSGTESKDAFQLALENNSQWASKTAQEQPNLFPALAAGQQPEILWIGCADSRCPETTLLGLQPGDVFVHRNIANVVQHHDLSSAAAIEFAVVNLKVKHIVVCGHTACGGVAAALANNKLGLLDTWLMPLRRLREENLKTLTALSHGDAVVRLAEINVAASLRVIREKSSVIEAIEGRGLKLHGAIYDVGTGKMRVLDSEESADTLNARLSAFKTS